MRETPLVTVVMIFLNAELFIQEAIESILAQTYPNWELQLVDDGSTDRSTAIALEYARLHSDRIHYVEHEGHQNRGMSASRNLGIREARGDYVAFLDADDVYLPPSLEQHLTLFSAQPAAEMVYSTTEYWYSWSDLPADQQLDRQRTLGLPTDTLFQPPSLVASFLRNQARTPATCSVLIRRDTIDRVGGFEERFRGMLEDQVFFYKVCLHAPIFVSGGCWSRYRQHLASWCHVKQQSGEWDAGDRRSPARAAFLNWLERYLTEQGIQDRTIWQLLRKELLPYRHPRLARPLYWLRRASDRLQSLRS
jgi:glycosyltransferase involved in cell wall biosynthesis